jgi:preprotein translocase subunit YajC
MPLPARSDRIPPGLATEGTPAEEVFVPLFVVWLLLMLGAVYLLLWRPQQRRMTMVRDLQSQLRMGDDVLTTSGIYARVVRLGDDDADLEIAPGTVVHVARGAIGQVLTEPDEPDEPDDHVDAPGEATEAG